MPRALETNFLGCIRAYDRDRARRAWTTSRSRKLVRLPVQLHFALKERGRLPQNASLNDDQLKKLIREVPDFPKKGILFYDITTLLKDKAGLATLVDRLAEHYLNQQIDLVLGMEARGFIFAPALAYRLNAGFVPVRKPGKLPAETVKFDYSLEYGTNSLEMHKDAIRKGQRVLIVDDLLATGGTAEATAKLATSVGAEIAGLGFVVELDFLKGRDKLKNYDVMSLLHYDK
jgi:adenine phosphoribosyltransferase